LVLGAGATLANAKHFHPERQKDTHPPLDTTFFEKLAQHKIQLPQALASYSSRLLGPDWERQMKNVRMEDFFKDLFFDFQSAPTGPRVRSAYTDLVTEYASILRLTTNWLCRDGRSGAPIGRLIASAARTADQLTVITFNHDLVIENEIYRRKQLRSRWCLERGYGALSDELAPWFTTYPSERDPEFPHHGPECDHEDSIQILKLHGSLNWFIRIAGRQPTAGVLSGKTGAKEVGLIADRLIQERIVYEIPAKRGRSKWYTWPVIIPPVYSKQALMTPIQSSWDDARAAIRECDRLTFFGYSLPDFDIEAEKLFQRGMARNRAAEWVDVINPDPGSAHRYARLLPKFPLRWYPDTQTFLALNEY
jgi:hypothetical protein